MELPLLLSRLGPSGVHTKVGCANRPERWRESMFIPGAYCRAGRSHSLGKRPWLLHLLLVAEAKCL